MYTVLTKMEMEKRSGTQVVVNASCFRTMHGAGRYHNRFAALIHLFNSKRHQQQCTAWPVCLPSPLTNEGGPHDV